MMHATTTSHCPSSSPGCRYLVPQLPPRERPPPPSMSSNCAVGQRGVEVARQRPGIGWLRSLPRTKQRWQTPSHIPSPPLPPPPASRAFSNWACGHGVRRVVRHIRSPIAHRDECSGGGGTGGGDGGGGKGGTRASFAWPHCSCRIELVCMCAGVCYPPEKSSGTTKRPAELPGMAERKSLDVDRAGELYIDFETVLQRLERTAGRNTMQTVMVEMLVRCGACGRGRIQMRISFEPVRPHMRVHSGPSGRCRGKMRTGAAADILTARHYMRTCSPYLLAMRTSASSMRAGCAQKLKPALEYKQALLTHARTAGPTANQKSHMHDLSSKARGTLTG